MNSSNYQVMFQGLDTLHVVFSGVLNFDWWEASKLKEKKRIAQSKREVPYVKIGSESWEVSPKGTPEYAYCLMRNDWRIYVLSNRGLKPKTNQVKIEIPSSRLRLGIEGLETEYRFLAMRILSNATEGIQRVDITADIAGFSTNDLHGYHLYGFASKMKSINSDLFLEKFYTLGKESEIETLVVGKNPQLRIYNKKKLSVNRDPDWFQCWYGKTFEEVLHSFDGDINKIPEITRFEFQLRSQTLKEFNIHYFEALIEKLQGLWDYMANQWLELKMDDPNKKVKRKLPSAPIWEFIRTLQFNGNLQLKRSKPFSRDSSKNFAQIMGHLAAFIAKEKMELLGGSEEQCKKEITSIFEKEIVNSKNWDWEKFTIKFHQKKNQFNGI